MANDIDLANKCIGYCDDILRSHNSAPSERKPHHRHYTPEELKDKIAFWEEERQFWQKQSHD